MKTLLRISGQSFLLFATNGFAVLLKKFSTGLLIKMLMRYYVGVFKELINLGGISKYMDFNDKQAAGKPRRKHIDWAQKTIRFELFIILTGSALLILAVVLYLAFGPSIAKQSQQLDSSKYQAVFLNIGQVYFGKVTTINDRFMVLTDVFYVNCNTADGTNNCQQNGNNTYTLYKLGVNELHAPQDTMVINQSGIAYWENIKDSSKVVQAIQQYKKNPNAANNQVNSSGSNGQNPATSNQGTGSTNQNTTQP